MARKVLFVLTSTAKMEGSDRKTGFHFSEMAEPYYILQDQGVQVDIASTQGGEAPIDNLKPRGENPDSVERFLDDQYAMDKIRLTRRLDSVNARDYAAIYLPGGHGTMWDFPNDARLARLIGDMDAAGKPVAAICHGPAAFVGAKQQDGRPLVADRKVNCFSDAEERHVELDGVVPFLLESKLREQGGQVEVAGLFEAKVVEDGNLLTGQNPASAAPLANRLAEMLTEARAQEAA
jgi:putative intracellular protease/amidase